MKNKSASFSAYSEEEHFEPVKPFNKYALEEHFEHKMNLVIKHNNIIYIIKQSCIQE